MMIVCMLADCSVETNLVDRKACTSNDEDITNCAKKNFLGEYHCTVIPSLLEGPYLAYNYCMLRLGVNLFL